MPKTSKLGWVYPTEGQTSWYAVFQALLNSQDADVYVSLEDPNLFLNGGGMITLDESGNILSWSEDLELLSTLTGGSVVIPAGTLSGFSDGKIAYVEVSRPVSGAMELSLGVADTLTGNRNRVFIALRRGSKVFVRNSANRSDVGTIDYLDANGFISGSVGASGGSESGVIPVGVNKGSIWKVRITALGNTVDSTIRFYSDSGHSNEVYSAANQDCYTSPYEDAVSWFVGVLTGGNLYYEITNDGANSSSYKIELVGIGDAG